MVLDRTEFTTWGGYGGLALRGRGDWTDTRLLLSDGTEHERLLGVDGDWLDLSGSIEGGEAGVLLLDHPHNHRHPVPWYASTKAATYGDEGWSNFANAAFLWHAPLEWEAAHAAAVPVPHRRARRHLGHRPLRRRVGALHGWLTARRSRAPSRRRTSASTTPRRPTAWPAARRTSTPRAPRPTGWSPAPARCRRSRPRGYEEVPLEPGAFVWFTPGTIHRLVNGGDLEILVLMQNAGLPEAGDMVITFPPEVLASAESYAAAATLPEDERTSFGTGDAARARRDLAVPDVQQAPRGDRSPATPRRCAPSTRRPPGSSSPTSPTGPKRWHDGPLQEVERTGDLLRALAEADPDHLADASVHRLPPPARRAPHGLLRHPRHLPPLSPTGGGRARPSASVDQRSDETAHERVISRWRSRNERSSSRFRRSQPVTSSLHLLVLQERQAGTMLSSV